MRLPSRRRADRRARFRSAAGVAGAGVLLVLSARTLNAAPLLLPGIGLIVLGALACVWVLVAAGGAGVRRSALPRRVTEGEAFAVTIEVSGRRLGLAPVVVNDPLSPGPLRVTRVPADRASGGPGLRRAELVARAGRRGRQLLGAPELVIGDPLGIAEVRRRGGGSADVLLVLPRVEPVDWGVGGRGRQSGEEGRAREPTGAGEVDGLRDYRAGTPATRIHWPALARGAGLVERRLVASTATLPLVVLDARCDDSPEGLDGLDLAVRAAASLTRELALGGGCALLLPNSRLPLAVGHDLRAWPGIHTQLALVEPEHNLRRSPALRSEHVNGPVFYVATERGLELPWLRRHAPGALLVTPAEPEDQATGSSFEVAGCVGQPLARQVRRAA